MLMVHRHTCRQCTHIYKIDKSKKEVENSLVQVRMRDVASTLGGKKERKNLETRRPEAGHQKQADLDESRPKQIQQLRGLASARAEELHWQALILASSDACVRLWIHRVMPGISSPTPKTRPLSFGISDAFPAEKAWKHHARLPHSKTGTIGGSRCPRKVRVRVKLRSGDRMLGGG